MAFTAAIDSLADGGIDGAGINRSRGRRSKKASSKAADIEARHARQRALRECTTWTDNDGMLCLNARLDPITGKQLTTRLGEISDRLWRTDGGRTTPPQMISAPPPNAKPTPSPQPPASHCEAHPLIAFSPPTTAGNSNPQTTNTENPTTKQQHELTPQPRPPQAAARIQRTEQIGLVWRRSTWLLTLP